MFLQRALGIKDMPVRRIVLILPCCIGDVVLATATLKALRQGYPDAHITWAVGSWSRPAIEQHDLLDAVLDTGVAALPVRSPGAMWRFVSQLRAGRFDLAVSLVRSPLMSLAVWLSAIPQRAGLDSAGRGFGYNIRAPIDPHERRHEAEIYLEVARALGLETANCWANVPVNVQACSEVRSLLAERGALFPFLVINPAGGRNPGMVMDSKRWPAQNFAALADRLAARMNARSVIILGGPDDHELVAGVHRAMAVPAVSLAGVLSFSQIAALASMALIYIGNDTGLTHLAAAAGAKTAMILGPSDPMRYAPFSPQSIAIWKPTALDEVGVSAGAPPDWEWERDGVSVDEAEERIIRFVTSDDLTT